MTIAKYELKWSELSIYKMQIEAKDEDEAWKIAMSTSGVGDIVSNDTQFESCKEIIEPAKYTVDVITDISTGQKEVSLRKEDNNG